MCSGSITFDEAGIMFEDIGLEFSFLLEDGNENRGKGFSWLESTGSGELDDTDCGTRRRKDELSLGKVGPSDLLVLEV